MVAFNIPLVLIKFIWSDLHYNEYHVISILLYVVRKVHDDYDNAPGFEIKRNRMQDRTRLPSYGIRINSCYW